MYALLERNTLLQCFLFVQDENAFMGILRQSCSPGLVIGEQDVAEVLMMMAQTQRAATSSSSSASQDGSRVHSTLDDALAAMPKTLAATMSHRDGAGKDGKGGKGGDKGQGAETTPPSSSSAANAAGANAGWNWRTVMDVIKAAAPALNWVRVAELLDHPSFKIPDLSGFTLLATAFRHAAGERLPARAFCGRVWDNYPGQLSFLRLAVTADPELFSFQGSERMAPPLDVLQQAGKSPTGTPNQAWLSIDLQQVLCYLFVDPIHQGLVRLMLQSALNECPEVRGCCACLLCGTGD